MNYTYKRAIAFRNQEGSYKEPVKNDSPKKPIKNANNSYQPLNVIIIDDDDLDVTLTQELLSGEKILNQPKVFNEPQKAVNFLTKSHEIMGEELPDLIMLDYSMPNLSGLDVLKTLRETPCTSEIPVIMLTSNDNDEVILEACNYKANGFLKKPIDVQSFLELTKTLPGFGYILGKKAT